jgi:signal transduction histidine kinase
MMNEIVAASPPLVLVVDDALGPRESIRLTLEPRYRVMTAESGEQALDVLRHQRADVVTLDSAMSGIGGLETFKRIREIDPDVEIIVVSAERNWREGLDPFLSREVRSWIAKPFDAAELVQAVEQAAERTRAARRRAEQSRAPTVQQLLSHELKNKLHGVLGFVQLLRDGRLDGANAAQALDAIEGNANEAVTLAVNFLHAEEIDGGALHLHKTAASLNQIVEKVLDEQAPSARLRQIDLRADLDSHLPSIDLDVAMIASALTNLVDNALHYSFQRGIVRVETRRFGNDIILRVRDHGPGIPADEIPRVFQKYGRGAKSTSRTSTGLGLYLVRTIVEAHGGSVSVTLPPGGGTAFVIALPCAPDVTP